MFFESFLLRERKRCLERITQISEAIEFLPDGLLQISQNRNGWRWRQAIPSANQTLRYTIHKKDRSTAEKLCYKETLLKEKENLIKNSELLDYLLQSYSFYPEKVTVSSNPEFFSLLASYYQKQANPSEQWAAEQFEQKTDYQQELTVSTKAGILVRSKSEAIIVNELFSAGIPFRYEQALPINDIIYYPDFTIKHPVTGKIYIWEHLGRMDSSDYAQFALRKLSLYTQFNYIPGDNLIVSFETSNSPLNVQYVEFLVYFYFCR